jgi:uncharacterized protein YegL
MDTQNGTMVEDAINVEPRFLPVILLLDKSGSMSQNGKIEALNSAVNEMIESFASEESTNIVIKVAIFVFGDVVDCIQPLIEAGKSLKVHLDGNGATPMGASLEMAKELIEDKTQITSRSYRPCVVLVSDGMPNDNWQDPLERFKSEGRTQKTMRMALGIEAPDGSPARKVLDQFVSDPEFVFSAKNAKDIRNFFQFVTMSVTTRVRSVDPNVAPDPKNITGNGDDDGPAF